MDYPVLINSPRTILPLAKMLERIDVIAEGSARLAPEPAFVFARELCSADVTSHVARLDERHFVVA